MEMLVHVDSDTVKCRTDMLLFPGLDLRGNLTKRLRASSKPFHMIEHTLDTSPGYADLCCSVDKEPGHITRHICLRTPPWRLGSVYVCTRPDKQCTWPCVIILPGFWYWNFDCHGNNAFSAQKSGTPWIFWRTLYFFLGLPYPKGQIPAVSLISDSY